MNNEKPLKIYVLNSLISFSTDSSDIGKTPLLEVEIDMGDSLLITQKTLYSSFKTY